MAEATYPAVGQPAPAFALAASTGKTIKLADLKGKVVVVYFYPKADTPGCTIQACALRDGYTALQKAGIEILGVSPDPVSDVTKFAEKFKLPFALLADEDHAVCEKYGVWQEKSMYGKKYMGAMRTTFIISKTGKVAHVMEKVKPDGHDQAVLEWVKANLS